MRYLFIFALLLVAASSIETRTLVAGDAFTLDDEQYTLTHTYDDSVVIRSPGGQSLIYSEDECIESSLQMWCVSSSRNESAQLELLEKEAEILMRRTAAKTVSIGGRVKNEFTIQNVGEVPLSLHVREVISQSLVSDIWGYDESLEWRGVLGIDQTKRFSYDISPLFPEDIDVETIISGDINESDDITIRVSDILSYSVDYTQNPSLGQEYNFSVSMRGTPLSEQDALVRLHLPEGVRVSSDADFSRSSSSSSTYTTHPSLNETTKASLLYVADAPVSEAFVLEVITDINGSRTRVQQLPLKTQDLLPLVLDARFAQQPMLTTPANFSLSLYNPNDESLEVSVEISGILLNDSFSDTLSPHQNRTYPYSLSATDLDSQYGLLVNARFSDENGDLVTSERFVRFEAKRAPPVAQTPSLVLSGPQIFNASANQVLTVRLHAVPAQAATLTWTRDAEVVLREQVGVRENDTFSYVVDAPGLYAASLQLENQSLREEFVVADVPVFSPNASAVSTQDVKEEDSVGLWPFIILAIALVGGGLVLRIRATVVRTQAAQELLVMHPRTAEQRRMRDELLEELYGKTNKK